MPGETGVIYPTELDTAMAKLREIFEEPIPALAGIRGEILKTEELLKLMSESSQDQRGPLRRQCGR